MITCPRCGFQAPDGTPWCPRCGYGAPQPELPQKIKGKKKKKLPGFLKVILIILGIIVLGFVGLVIWAVVDTAKDPEVNARIKATQQQRHAVYTMTAERKVILSATPTFTAAFTETPTKTPAPTKTPLPTRTPKPTRTPWPTKTLQPVLFSYTEPQTYTDNSGIRGSVVQDTSNNACRIKGNINNKGERIYHCPGWRDYNKTNIDEWKGERWFCSAAEAEAAGWRAAAYNHGACIN